MRGSAVRAGGLAAMAAGLALLTGLGGLTGCGAPAAGADRAAGAGRTAAQTRPSPTRWPAAIAGGACQLLDYDVITTTVGFTFDVAAAGQTGGTYTCVLEQSKAKLPDMSLSIASTQADPTVFKKVVAPKGSAAVPDLGKAGYSAVVAATAGAGPVVEVGWLSGNQRIITLRLRTAASTAAADAAALVPKLVALAKQIDMINV